jgi:heterodisulfide reductase subunit B
MIPVRFPHIEAAARMVFNQIGVKLIDSDEFTCCPDPVGVRAFDEEVWLTLAARNITIGEKLGKNILTLCNGCLATLSKANRILKEDSVLKANINKVLTKINRQFKGTIKITHGLTALVNDFGLNHLKEYIEYPLDNFRVAVHYGCHFLKPSEYLRTDDPESPTIFENLLSMLRVESVEYETKSFCCGAALEQYNKDSALNIIHEKVQSIIEKSVDCIVLLCPFCFKQLDQGQIILARKKKINSTIPVFHLFELLGLGLGIKNIELCINRHKVKPIKFMENFYGNVLNK